MKKGFTLVEVLIVVVIIAILASLIVPRMLMQTEKAKAAEAIQMVGAMKRAAERYYDFHGTYDLSDGIDSVCSDPSGTDTENEAYWADLGLTGLEKSKDWIYLYVANGTSSYYVSGKNTSGDRMQFDSVYGALTDVWTCRGVFKPVEAFDANYHSYKGCAI